MYDLIQILFNVGLVQGILTVMGYFNESIRVFYDNFLPAVSNIKLDNLVQRTRGFTNLGGAWLSSLFTISFLCGLFKIEQGKYRLFYLLGMLIMVLGMIFTGRTGLVISIIYMLMYFVRWMYIHVAKRTIGYIFSSIIIGGFLIFLLIPDNVTLINEATLNWAFEMFMGDNIGETRSGNHLMTMLYIPQPVSNFIWGSGQYFAGTLLNPRTDSGFMKSILSVGLIGSIAFYGLYLLIFYKTITNLNKFDKGLGFLAFCILTSTLLIEIKEPYLSTLGYTFIIFVLFFMSEISLVNRPHLKQ